MSTESCQITDSTNSSTFFNISVVFTDKMDLNNKTNVGKNLKTHNILSLCRSCLCLDTEMFSLFSDSTSHVPAFFDQFLHIKVKY